MNIEVKAAAPSAPYVTFTEEQLTFPDNVVVVGITGKAGSGKDTFAEYVTRYLEDNLSISSPVMALADALKLGVAQMLYVIADNFYDTEIKDSNSGISGKTNRELLQFVGTELMRTQFSPDVWVFSLIQRVRNFTQFTDWPIVVLIPDVRFYNEARPILKAKHGFLVEVTRNGLTSKGIEGHASEKSFISELDGKEYTTVTNDGSLDDLYAEANKFAEYVIVQAGIYLVTTTQKYEM